MIPQFLYKDQITLEKTRHGPENKTGLDRRKEKARNLLRE